MKLLKKSRAVVHTLLGFVQTWIGSASWSVVGLSLGASTEIQWIDDLSDGSAKQWPAQASRESVGARP